MPRSLRDIFLLFQAPRPFQSEFSRKLYTLPPPLSRDIYEKSQKGALRGLKKGCRPFGRRDLLSHLLSRPLPAVGAATLGGPFLDYHITSVTRRKGRCPHRPILRFIFWSPFNAQRPRTGRRPGWPIPAITTTLPYNAVGVAVPGDPSLNLYPGPQSTYNAP